MSTRYGAEKAQKLSQLGWTIKEESVSPDMRVGDPIMISPYNNEEYNPYDAEKAQDLIIGSTWKTYSIALDDDLNRTA